MSLCVSIEIVIAVTAALKFINVININANRVFVCDVYDLPIRFRLNETLAIIVNFKRRIVSLSNNIFDELSISTFTVISFSLTRTELLYYKNVLG